MPWFGFSSDTNDLVLCEVLIRAALSVEKGRIPLISEQFLFLGPEYDKPCHAIRDNDRLLHLHERLFRYLESIDFKPLHENYIGAGYWAHVSDSAEKKFSPGSMHIATKLVLIVQDEYGTKQVWLSEELGNPYEAKAGHSE